MENVKKVRIDNSFLNFFALDENEIESIKVRLEKNISFCLELDGLYAVIDLERECLHVRRLDGRIRENIKQLDLFLIAIGKVFNAKTITGNFKGSPSAILKLAKKLGYFFNPQCEFEVMKEI